jgi:hypothetical protein
MQRTTRNTTHSSKHTPSLPHLPQQCPALLSHHPARISTRSKPAANITTATSSSSQAGTAGEAVPVTIGGATSQALPVLAGSRQAACSLGGAARCCTLLLLLLPQFLKHLNCCCCCCTDNC